MTVYAMSDIHGNFQALEKALDFLFNKTKISIGEDKLIFLGDYIDRSPDGYSVLKTIYDLQQKYGKENIIVLMGNHDEMFLEWLKQPYNTLHLINDKPLTTVKSFIKPLNKGWDLIFDGVDAIYDISDPNNQIKVTQEVIDTIKTEYKELLDWYQNLDYFYEHGNALFVHAGFEEVPGWHWTDSSKEEMTWKYPASLGYTPWNKEIVAGHIMTRELHPEGVPQEKEDSIYRNKDHIFIDGAAPITNHINILAYDENGYLYYDAETGEILPE